MLSAITAALMALSTITFPPGGAPGIVPPPDHITIEVVTVLGSGCPTGTAAVAVSPDNKAFTVTYSDFLAQVGIGALPTDFRKNCQLNLRVNVPQGFTYGIAQADYRGFAHLEAGASGTERANYYFQGMSPTSYKSHSYNGPMSDDWQATDSTEVAAIVYSPCGELRNFNINTELRVAAGTSDPKKTTSFMAMDSTDGSIETTYHFAWKQCT
ncbi:DUF4360 domain-containing protein [Umezawaea sp. Da 62-37]|uniref:DUF4360 domain-containing protein n=1 Tax=Umezawaea sp. Da 62-37 TaxID=3075927 RepID=UPI0028F7254A|nr:DUF4360 domain-containing protein [Umezawaea sp. Da 62-37]WNV84454.1 DUF4360 domain-containing protein [Umezawaea sp. Da 62-37]